MTINRHRTTTWIFFAALGILAVTGAEAHAARLLAFELYQGDKLIMTAINTDAGQSSPSELWDFLYETTWAASEGFTPPVLDSDPLQAVLDGPVKIRISHAQKDTLAVAEVDGLVLVRDVPDSLDWKLPPEEVIRTGIAAGVDGTADVRLVGVSPGTLSKRLTLIGGLCAGGFLLVIAVVVVLVISQTSRRNSISKTE